MKTNWTNWGANTGVVTATYIAQREWDKHLPFYASIHFLIDGTFEVVVEDFQLFSLEEDGDNRVFNTFEEAFAYLSDIDCEKYLDDWEDNENEYQKRMEEQESKK